MDDQIEIIMQKYIHLNLMAPNECWTELRRTRHPKLEPVNFPPYFTNIKPQVERIKYQDSEELNNTENFAKVKAENNYSSPIYYVPQDKRSESYYRDTFHRDRKKSNRELKRGELAIWRASVFLDTSSSATPAYFSVLHGDTLHAS